MQIRESRRSREFWRSAFSDAAQRGAGGARTCDLDLPMLENAVQKTARPVKYINIYKFF